MVKEIEKKTVEAEEKAKHLEKEIAELKQKLANTTNVVKSTTPEIRVVKEWTKADPFKVPDEVKQKYPDGHFFWCRCEEERINVKEGQGYEIVTAPQRAKRRKNIKGARNPYSTKGDTTVRHGDTILMVIPREDWEARQKWVQGKVDRRTRKAEQQFRGEVQKVSSGLGHDIPTFGRGVETH